MNSLEKASINQEIDKEEFAQLQQTPQKVIPLFIKLGWILFICTTILRFQDTISISWWWFGGIFYVLFFGTFLYFVANRPGRQEELAKETEEYSREHLQ